MDQDQVSTILTAGRLEQLRRGYDRPSMSRKLVGTLPLLYAHSTEYLNAIGDLLYGTDLPEDDDPAPRSKLSVRDRERCLVAILASREEGMRLAIHIYIALMEGVSPEEVAHILLLVGVYSGVDHLSGGLMTEIQVLKLLNSQTDCGSEAIVKALMQEFQTGGPRPAPPPAARGT